MEICPKETCTGCLACYNACSHKAIELRKDEEGFIYPEINAELCVDCGLCKSVCPIIVGTDDVTHEPLATYAAWNRDKHVVRKSSSGGLFTTIAEWVLAKNGVIYGAAFDENLHVRHRRVDTITDLERLRGSKYVQSFIGESYQLVREDLELGRWVLFSGTPCQIGGLKKILNDKICEKLITIDIVCHGVPSPLIFEEYKNYLERKYQSKIVSYSFRDKKWSWNLFNMRATFENGAEYIGKWEEDIFFRGFLRELYQRPACHTCHFTSINRCGDFTCRHEAGEKHDFDKGVSMILVNSEKAKNVLEDIKQGLYCYSRTIDDAKAGNECLYTPFEMSPERESFWIDYQKYGYDALIDKYLYPEKMSKSSKRLYKYGKFINLIYKTLQRGKHRLTKLISNS